MNAQKMHSIGVLRVGQTIQDRFDALVASMIPQPGQFSLESRPCGSTALIGVVFSNDVRTATVRVATFERRTWVVAKDFRTFGNVNFRRIVVTVGFPIRLILLFLG